MKQNQGNSLSAGRKRVLSCWYNCSPSSNPSFRYKWTVWFKYLVHTFEIHFNSSAAIKRSSGWARSWRPCSRALENPLIRPDGEATDETAPGSSKNITLTVIPISTTFTQPYPGKPRLSPQSSWGSFLPAVLLSFDIVQLTLQEPVFLF